LHKAQEEGAETDLVTLANKTISPCDACYFCSKTGRCHIKDDMQDVYSKLLEADGIIFGSPVYYWNVSAQAKALIDRTYVFREKRDLRNKVVGAVIAQTRLGATSALSVLAHFFIIQRMIMVGRAIGFGKEKGEVRNDKQGIAEAEILGTTIVKYIQYHEVFIPKIHRKEGVKNGFK